MDTRTLATFVPAICLTMTQSASASLPPPPAGVQVTTSYGIEFSTIAAAGNRGTTASEAPQFAQSHGAVGYEYRIARAELTVGQWFEFVQAYAPFYNGALGDPSFTGLNITPVTSNPRGAYAMVPGTEMYPAQMSPRFAARYCNWLQNGKATAQAAFESGVYDTSTFVLGGPLNLPQDQIGHSPNAQFWIPTIDEWIKAAYFDPNRGGVGAPGYWKHPNSSDSLLTSGQPGTPGAETNGGLPQSHMAVASYPGTQTPWGLFDVSGGAREPTDSLYSIDDRLRYALGSTNGDPLYFAYDELGFTSYVSVYGSETGLRLAAGVPEPLCGVGVVFLMFINHRRRIHRDDQRHYWARCP